MKTSARGHFPLIPGIFLIFFFIFLYVRDPLFKNVTPGKNPDTAYSVGEAPVFSVIDGDTIAVLVNEKEETVRLIGIDSPEYGKNGTGECYHEEATVRMREIVGLDIVRLEAEPNGDDRDKYGRLLRFVFLTDGTNVGEMMVREGFAREYTYLGKPYTLQADFAEAEKQAKAAGLGIWGVACK